MKSIKDLREADDTDFKARLPEVVISESVISEEETDDVSQVLLALNHLATMTDDLYSVIGDEDIKISEDEILAILNSYDAISEIYDKYEGMVSMPSREYDIDALDVEVMEELEEELIALEEAVGVDNPMHHGVSAKALDTLEKLGFRGAPVGPNTWKPSQKVLKMWGIPMRAGKYADVFFASLDVNNGESRQFAIADSDGVEKYKDLDKAIASLKKKAKLNESVEELEETPGGPSPLQKINAAIDGFQKKLASGKYPDSESDLKKILARLEAQKKALTPKKEEVELDEASSPMKDWSDSRLLLWLKTNWTTDSVSPVFGAQLKSAAAIAKKRGLKWTKNEEVEIHEAEMKIVSWKYSKGINDPFRMEVVGQNGTDVAKILDKVLPSGKFNLYGDDLGFKSAAEREAAAKALVKFYKTIKEQDCTELDLSLIAEEFDESKFRRLAVTGLVPEGDVAKIILAMKRLDSGKELTRDQKNLVTSTFHSLVGMVTGDMSVFTKIQNKLKKD